MTKQEEARLHDVPGELNYNESPTGSVCSVLKSFLDTLNDDCKPVAEYLVPKGWEGETDGIYRTRLALSRSGQDMEGVASLVAYWLKKCDALHSQCVHTPTPGWPCRLIDLIDYDTAPSSVASKVKVIETNTEREPYCALSYRWPSDPLCLTSETSGVFHAGLSAALLPQPIQDICILAKHLGFRYAWVDALCIKQGTDGDWHREAKKMANIYMNARFTLAAVDGTPLAKIAPVQDFLFDSDRVITPENRTLWRYQVQNKLSETNNIPTRQFGELDTRGWAFQERMLSRITISITKTDIFWDCLQHSASGRRPCGTQKYQNRQSDNEYSIRRLLLRSPRAPPDLSFAYRQWRHAIQDYSERSFSYGEDRLIALDGIISRLSCILDDTCLVGIWKRDAVKGLTWFSNPTETNAGPPDISAPSWSWLSVNGRISYNWLSPKSGYMYQETGFDNLQPTAVVERISARADDDTVFSKFRGELQIRGPVMPAHVIEQTVFFDMRQHPPVASAIESDPGKKRQMLLDEKLRPENKRIFRHERLFRDARPLDPNGNGTENPSDSRGSESHCPQMSDVKCLLLCDYTFTAKSPSRLNLQLYLVLEQVNAGPGTDAKGVPGGKSAWRRIGLCCVRRERPCDPSIPHVRNDGHLCHGEEEVLDVV